MQRVAELAGVSTATVSRVLAGVPGATSEATAERVRRTASHLGYVVNAVASSLRSRQTSTIGLILADVANPFFGRLASGVESVLSRAGYSLLLANSGNSVETEAQLLRVMREKQVDAIILASAGGSGAHIREALAKGSRIVLADTEYPDLPLDAVVIDNAAAAEEAAGHLLDLGHRRLAVLTGPLEASFDRERLAGVGRAFAKRGLALDPSLVARGDSTFEAGKRATRTLLAAAPTAVFATNNLMCAGAITALLDAGLRIPEDISVLGFDDMDWFPIFRPAISAVAQPVFELGVAAAERLLEVLEADGPGAAPRRAVLETTLILRASTASCPPA
ncbi:LacI family transcriptional regulator [Aureimonas endophytica]|uniref:LacI family transcriptional regulator n=2 Tax=Aureimonas endophytica TaxID=2027858 RepID=A0A917E4Y9_9HYPH|nr:LacI family transcriptional regulator [Aureimonas endophytica]